MNRISYSILKGNLHIFPRREQYSKLLQTWEWYDMRKRILERDDHKCVLCNIPEEDLTIISNEQKEKECENYITKNLPVQKKLAEFYKAVGKIPPSENMVVQNLRNGFNTMFISNIITYNTLQVHHTYYLAQTLPWNYSEDILQTVCVPCHQKIHQNTKIPIYYDEKLDLVVANMYGCPKCGGTGWIEEYNHVQAGICFDCGGSGGDICLIFEKAT